MFFRKGGTSSAILATALLVAIIASANSIVNYMNSEATALESMVDIGQTYLVLQKNSTSIMNSEVAPDVTNLLTNRTDVKYVLPQRIFAATLTTNLTNRTVVLSTTEDLPLFFNVKQAQMRGETARPNSSEVNMGVALASLTSTNISDLVTLTMGDKSLRVKVTGIFETLTQSDTEIVAPTEIAHQLMGENSDKVSFIEFSLKTDSPDTGATTRIEEVLPKDVKIVKVQQLKSFIQAVNNQTLSFLDLWSLSIFIVITAASYIVATKLITESNYELAMLRSIGGNRKLLFALIFIYTVSAASLGAVLGLSIGIVGAQAASTVASWIRPGITLTPFIEIEQALQILAFTFISATLGCLYPAFKHAFKFKMEETL